MTASRKIEDTLTGILAMDNVQKKADAVILEIRRNEQKLEKLGENLVEEKSRLQKTERKGMNEKLHKS